MEINYTAMLGQKVCYKNAECEIKRFLEDDIVVLEEIITCINHNIAVSELLTFVEPDAVIAKPVDKSIPENGLEEAKRRRVALDALAKMGTCPRGFAEVAGTKLGISWRQVYKLIKRYRESGYELESLIPRKSLGGKGKSRLKSEVEAIIQETTDQFATKSSKINFSALVAEIQKRCQNANLKVPAYVTVWKRVQNHI